MSDPDKKEDDETETPQRPSEEQQQVRTFILIFKTCFYSKLDMFFLFHQYDEQQWQAKQLNVPQVLISIFIIYIY